MNTAGSGLDHLLGQQVGRLLVAEPCVNVGDDGHDVRLEVVNLVGDDLLCRLVPLLPGLVQLLEQAGQLAGVGLLQERVDLGDELRHGRLLVHRLVGKGAELRPGGEIILQFLTVLKT